MCTVSVYRETRISNMAKPLFGLIAAVAVSTSLAACGSNEEQAAATPPPAAQTPQPVTPPSPPPAAQPMSPQQRIEAVQTALNSNGAHLTVDGHMGPKTEAALRSFQRQHNLHVTGRPDSATVSALGIQG
jgi:peptidoglycan hydrolase-like protein with peptidoglycan-binding domain